MDPEERKELILAGNIEPIDVSVKLQKKELAYISMKAQRIANIDRTVEKTVGNNRRKGVLTRGIIGGVAFGGIGALAGAMTAGTKSASQTTQKTVSKYEMLDSGELIFTNQRVLFVGNKEIVSLDYDEIIDYKFGRNLLGRTFVPKYQDMLPNETFIISGPASGEAETFFEGITQNLVE